MMDKLAQYAPATVRVGISLVFIWFGLEQLLNVSEWTGWLPAYATALPISATTLVYLNGAFETVFGLMLLFGLFTRLSAGLLCLHMAHIISVVGYGEIGVRDFGIFVAALSVFFHGKDNFSLDSVLARKKEGQSI